MKMKRKRGKMIAVTLIMLVLMSGFAHGESTIKNIPKEVIKQNITPFWAKFDNIFPYLSAEGTTLYPEITVEAKVSSDRISGTMYLEKYSSRGWTNVTSWSFSGTGEIDVFKSYRGTRGAEYRVRAVVKINNERTTSYSDTCLIR